MAAPSHITDALIVINVLKKDFGGGRYERTI
jgi:hypothetical protein